MVKRYPKDHWNREQDPESAIAKYKAVLPTVDKDIILNKIINFDLKGKTVLDYGCGIGYFSVELAKRGAIVTGLDISEEAITTATYYAGREGVGERCSFYQSGSEFSKLQTLSVFDMIFFKDVIEHIEEDTKFMSLLVPHLKLNRPIIITTPNTLSIGHFIGVIYNKWYKHNADWVGGADETHVKLYSPWKLAKMLKRFGLKREKIHATSLIPGDIVFWLTFFKKNIPFDSSLFDRTIGGYWPFCYFGAQQLCLFKRS